MQGILTARQPSLEEVDSRIAGRIVGFSCPTLVEILALPSKLEFGYFTIFCTVVGLDYHEVVNGVGFSEEERAVYWRWAVTA